MSSYRLHKVVIINVVLFLLFLVLGQPYSYSEKLIILDPGHFHASLLQKNSIKSINDTVQIYAPSNGPEIQQYLSNIRAYNNRDVDPTNWTENLYIGKNYLQKMKTDKKGDFVVLAGNNKKKTEYIYQSVKAGFNVLSDKPLAITPKDFGLLKKAFEIAEKNHLIIYDLMTERYDMLNIVERELINDTALFGTLTKGTIDCPSISMKSVHHFCKKISGTTLVRPAWYYDIAQQGEGIADVTVHLIDLINWQCFPNKAISQADISLHSAEHYPTILTYDEFEQSTNMSKYPKYLKQYLKSNNLYVMSNGNINYAVFGVNMSIDVQWKFMPEGGADDTFSSVIKGSKAVIEIVQNKNTKFSRCLFVSKTVNISNEEFNYSIKLALNRIQKLYPFVYINKFDNGTVNFVIPNENMISHENQFNKVVDAYLLYLEKKSLPNWENENTLTKYFITTEATVIAK